MELLRFSIAITGPIFLVVALGYGFRRLALIDAGFVDSASRLVFRVGLPVILFVSIYHGPRPHGGEILGAVSMAVGTLLLIGLLYAWCRLTGARPEDRGVIIQGGYRGNLAVVGLAFCGNAYGAEGLAAAAVPMAVLTLLYNFVAVLVLGGGADATTGGWRSLPSLLLRNPLVLGILAGFAWKATGIELPVLLLDTAGYFSAMTLPLALLCIGATLEPAVMRLQSLSLLASTAFKLVVSPLLLVAVALAVGWRGQFLGVVFFLASAPTAAASFVMARAMQANASLAAAIVVATTLLSAFTVTLGIAVLRYFELA